MYDYSEQTIFIGVANPYSIDTNMYWFSGDIYETKIYHSDIESDDNLYLWYNFENNSKFKRKDIINHLESNKIQTRPYFAGNIMLQPAYNGLIDKNEVITKYPNARKITTDTFFLGTSPVITSIQLDYVESIVQNFFKKN